MFVADKEGKRISGHDRLRLYEQILELKEVDEEESERRGLFCAKKLLLPQAKALSGGKSSSAGEGSDAPAWITPLCRFESRGSRQTRSLALGSRAAS